MVALWRYDVWCTIAVFALSFAVRVYRVGEPGYVVFDEQHHVSHILHYVSRIFFLDAQPALFKFISSAVAFLNGITGTTANASAVSYQAGSLYPAVFPVCKLRLLSVFSGSCIPPLAFVILQTVGVRGAPLLLTAFLLCFEPSLIVESRYITARTMTLAAVLFVVYCYFKVTNLTKRTGSSSTSDYCQQYVWLTCFGLSIGFAISLHYSSIYTILLLYCLVTRDLYYFNADQKVDDASVIIRFVKYFSSCIIVPVIFYLSVFFINLIFLVNAGPHHHLLSASYYASLNGSMNTVIHGQPLFISYGSQLTLRHPDPTFSDCWLHSHTDLYPAFYPDGRGSSHQQQVTCYPFRDANNLWIVKRPHLEGLSISGPVRYLKHGDLIELVHSSTKCRLNTHFVAAPVTAHEQEVSGYIDYNVSMPMNSLWYVDIVNRESNVEFWQTHRSFVRLVHFNSSTVLKVTGRTLPDWGYNQLEVSAAQNVVENNGIWIADFNSYVTSGSVDFQAKWGHFDFSFYNQDEAPENMNIWQTFYELQLAMLSVEQEMVEEHPFSSHPLLWPALKMNIIYWYDKTTGRQIHFLGNSVVWYSSTASVVICLLIGVFHILRRTRHCYDIPEVEFQKLKIVAEVVLGGYFVNYLPYFFYSGSLFSYQYSVALVFKVMLFSSLLDHIQNLFKSTYTDVNVFSSLSIFVAAVIIYSAIVLNIFIRLMPVIYGLNFNSTNLTERYFWLSSWEIYPTT